MLRGSTSTGTSCRDTVGFASTRHAGLPRYIVPCTQLAGLKRPCVKSSASYLGIDFGTSGARAVVIDDEGRVLAEKKQSYGEKAADDWADSWRSTLFRLLHALEPSIRSDLGSIAFDGTSATALLVDPTSGAVLQRPKLYNESQDKAAVELAKSIAPVAHTATASTSTLCKLITWHTSGALAAKSQHSTAQHASSAAQHDSARHTFDSAQHSTGAAAAAPAEGPRSLQQTLPATAADTPLVKQSQEFLSVAPALLHDPVSEAASAALHAAESHTAPDAAQHSTAQHTAEPHTAQQSNAASAAAAAPSGARQPSEKPMFSAAATSSPLVKQSQEFLSVAPALLHDPISEAAPPRLTEPMPAATSEAGKQRHEQHALEVQSSLAVDRSSIITGWPLLLHQADWLAGLLHGRWGVSDWNNALKLGYDPGHEAYPAWLTQQPYAHALPPTVLPPGAPIASVTAAVASECGLPADCIVCAGTTDSIAAFIAADVYRPGQAVSSLGSTLAVKLLSTTRVDDAAYGVYSHRLGDVWLVGGASNTGGAVLRQFFSDVQLAELTPRLQMDKPTGLDYYPLTCPGERFPVNDPNLQPKLQPRPDDDAIFLQGIFEGIARIEAEAYSLLARLGASPVTEVVTAGGGAVNPKWTAIREAALKVPVRAAVQGEAAYGAALLARQGYKQQHQQNS